MSEAATGLLDLAWAAAIRAVRGRGRVVELGAPPTWPQSEVRRVRRQALGIAVRTARRWLAAPLLVIAVGIALVVVAHLPALLVLIVIVLLGAFGCWRVTRSGRVVLDRWRRWAHGRHDLERELRLLDSGWRLLWDRRLDALPDPVTIAVGPSGAWILWFEPVMTTSIADDKASDAILQVAGLSRLPTQLHAWTGAEPVVAIREFVQSIACAPVRASADQVGQGAQMLDVALLQEPVRINS